MLVIRTGKPGHGKTLNAIREIDQQAFKQGRPVYYHNINGLKPHTLKASWFAFDDPHLWYELPPNSIIVVDEAQGWFAGRDSRSRPPEYITRFEVMRHSGFEVHLITQDPRYLDVHLRRLSNSHIHFWRVFKSQRLLRFESEVVVEKVEVLSSFKDADKRRVTIDSGYFDSYTSANADHHFKTKIPLKLVLFVIVVAVFFVWSGLFIYSKTSSDQDEVVSAPGSVAPAPGPAPSSPKDALGSLISPVGRAVQEQHVSTERYIELHTPRIPDVPSSAPIYDELTKPVSYPRLSCVMSSDPDYIDRNSKRYRVIQAGDKGYICECFSQQGTWHKTRFAFCKATVERGYFDPAIPDRQPQPQLQASPDGGVAEPAKQTATGGRHSVEYQEPLEGYAGVAKGL